MDSPLGVDESVVRQILAARHAERGTIESSVGDDNETLVVQWTDLRIDHIPSIIAFLKTYTWPTNKQAQSWVQGPLTFGEKVYGTAADRWRCVRVWTEDRTANRLVSMELRRGMLTAADFASSVPWDEARKTAIVSVDDEDETRVVVTWENVDREEAWGVVKVLEAPATYTDIEVEGETFAGTWYCLRALADRQKDGSAEVQVVLSREPAADTTVTRVGTLRPQTVTRYRHVPLQRVSAIQGLHGAPGDRETKDVTVDINAHTGEAQITVVETSITQVTQDKTFASAWDTKLRVIRDWNVTNAEVLAAYTTHGMTTHTEGVTKEAVVTNNGDGTFDYIFSIRDVRDRTVYDYDLDVSWYEERTALDRRISRFHLTEAEANQFLAEFQVNTPPSEGVRYSFRIDRSFQHGLYTATILIRTSVAPVAPDDIIADLTTDGAALALSGITHPGAEAEAREYRWPDVPFSAISAIVERLDDPPSGWGVVSIQVRRNHSDATAEIGYQIQKVGTQEVQTTVRGVGAEVRQVEVLLLNRASAPSVPTTGLDGFTLVDQETRHRGENLTDYVFRFVRRGTDSTLETRRTELGSEAETVERVLFHRASPPTAPTVPGFLLVASAKDDPGGVLPTYRFSYARVGATNWVVSISEPDQDVEVRDVRLINRSAEPEVPTLTGFVYVGRRVINPDAVLSDYEYVFRRVGTGNDVVRTDNPSAERELVEYVYPSRATDPNPDPPTSDYVRMDAWRTNPSATLSDYHYRFAKKGTSTFAVTELATSADVGAVEYVRYDRAPGSDIAPPTIGGYQHTGTRTEGRGTPLENRVYQFRRIGTAEYVAVSRWAALDRGSRRVEFLQRTADPMYTAPEGWVIDTVATRDHGSPLVDYVYDLRRIGTEALNVQTVEAGTDAEVLQVVYLQRQTDPAPAAASGYTLRAKSRAGAGEALGDWTYVWVKNGVSAWTIRTVGSGTTAETITDVYFSRTASPNPLGTGWSDRTSTHTLMSEAVQTQGGNLADYQFVWRKTGTVGTYTSGGVETPAHLRRDIEVVRSIPESGLAAAIEDMETIGDNRKVVEAVRPTEVSPGVYDIRRSVLTLPSPIVEESNQVERFEGGGRVASWQAYTEKVSYAQDRDAGTGEVTDVGLLNVPRVAPYTLHVAGKQVRKIHVRNTMSWHKTRPETLEPGATGTYLNHTFRRLQHDPRGFWVEQLSEVTISEWTSALA